MNIGEIAPVIPCTILVVIGIVVYNIAFILRKRANDTLTAQQERAVKGQYTAVAILIFVCVFSSLAGYFIKQVSPGAEMSLNEILGSGIWLLAGLIGMYIGISAILYRVIIFTGRGSSTRPTGCFAVFEGAILILVILIVLRWLLFQP